MIRFTPDTYYSRAEVAEVLGVSYTYISNCDKNGDLRGIRIGNVIHYRGSKILEWLDSLIEREEYATP